MWKLALLNGTMSWEQSWAISDLSTIICENKVPKRQQKCLGLRRLGVGSHYFSQFFEIFLILRDFSDFRDFRDFRDFLDLSWPTKEAHTRNTPERVRDTIRTFPEKR